MEANPIQSVYTWGLFNGQETPIPQKVKELDKKGVINVASGGHFYLAVTENGNLYGWGNSKYNRFGIQSPDPILIPKIIPTKTSVRAISAGNWHSIIIDANKHLWAVGHNKQGGCGVGTFQNVKEYTELKTSFLAGSIACGDSYSLVISTEGDLYSCGHTEFHGHKKAQHLNIFKKLNFGEQKVKSIAAGYTCSLAVTQNGENYSWGLGECFQLGHGNKNSEKQPRIIKRLSDIKVVNVSCTRGQKNSHSMAVAQSGELYTWGGGYKGKLGHQSKWSHENPADEPQPRKVEALTCKIVKASAGGIHSNILNDNGEVLSFGCGSNGRLGHIESKQYVYLYREGFPRAIESLKGVFITNIESSYYHNICVGYPRQ